MPALEPDVLVTLPPGWSKTGNPGGTQTYSPDGNSALQMSRPPWAPALRGQDRAALTRHIAEMVETGRLGRVVATGGRELPYGLMVEADIASDVYAEAHAWLIVPASHDIVLATWLSHSTAYGAAARRIIDGLQPGLFSSAIASAIEIAGEALAAGELMPHAVLFGNGELTHMQLATLPQEVWDEACRVERASVNAEIVVQVVPATADGADVAVIYAESSTRHRRVVVGVGPLHELDAERVDLFKAADPDFAAALAAARVD